MMNALPCRNIVCTMKKTFLKALSYLTPKIVKKLRAILWRKLTYPRSLRRRQRPELLQEGGVVVEEKTEKKTGKSKKTKKTKKEKEKSKDKRKSKSKKEEAPEKEEEETEEENVPAPEESSTTRKENIDPISTPLPLTVYEDDNVRVTSVTGVQSDKTPSVTLNFAAEGKSKTKVKHIDIIFPDRLARLAGLPSGDTPGSVRIATNLRKKKKGSSTSRTVAVPVDIDSSLVSTVRREINVELQMEGQEEPTTSTASLTVLVGQLLKPISLTQSEYKDMLTNTKGELYDVNFNISLNPSEVTMRDFLNSFGQVVQCAEVMCTDMHAIVYAMGSDGSHFTCRFKMESDHVNTSLKGTHRELVNTLKDEVENNIVLGKSE
eukprot:gb/GECG01001088.1/.p1 GENE.gb/GECG01001088.1/~~gb/GECG01001088.1/.p1  ORF type:complete len:377 (+),score=62.53 gb/GECG01001088.1/:1-1131(+)